MLRVAVWTQCAAFRMRSWFKGQRGGIDDLLMRGLFVVAVLGIAAAVIAYFSGLNNWIGNKLQTFMNSH